MRTRAAEGVSLGVQDHPGQDSSPAAHNVIEWQIMMIRHSATRGASVRADLRRLIGDDAKIYHVTM
jgi:hypothetical protein